MHLTNLSQLLRPAGGTRTANELDELCQLLQPFRNRKVKDLIASISKAEDLIRTGGPAPRKARGSSKPIDLAAITARILDLYQNAGLPSVTRDQILDDFSEIESLNLTVKQLEAIGKQIGVTEKLKKVDLINKMRQTVLDRKGAADRVFA
jgi:hypothetical protein